MKNLFIFLIFSVIILVGCQSTNENDNNSTGSNSELVDTYTKLTSEDFAKNSLKRLGNMVPSLCGRTT